MSAPDTVNPAATALTASQAAASQASIRVHVDQDGEGVFTYRLVDVTTGQVLVELPRERADELKDVAGYERWTPVSASA